VGELTHNIIETILGHFQHSSNSSSGSVMGNSIWHVHCGAKGLQGQLSICWEIVLMVPPVKLKEFSS
jgi:hypothetical protein